MDIDNSISSEDLEEQNYSDNLFNKFKLLAGEFFEKEKDNEVDYLRCIKESAKLYSFTLPPYLVDVLIVFEEAPFFWLTDSPFVLSLEEFFKRHYGKLYDKDSIKAIKGFYTKWAIQKETESKSYFAKSALALLEKNPQKNNFVIQLYQGTILTFDVLNCNTEKALELFSKAKETIASLNLKQNLREEAIYLVSAFSGFAYLKEGDIYKASEEFSAALANKSTGITAKYYLSYLNVIQGNEEQAAKLAQEIFLNDMAKVQYAISVNSNNLMIFFITNAASHSFFKEKAFIPLTDFFHELLKQSKKTAPEFIDALNNKLHVLHELHYEEYYDKEINEIIPFIGKTYQAFKGSKNVFLLANADKLLSKFDKIHEIIFSGITKKLSGQMKETLKPYDNQINDNTEKIKLLLNEVDIARKATKEEHDQEVKIIEDRANSMITEVENEIGEIKLDKKFDPQVAFTNSMFYNLLISFAVFVLAGLASYSNSSNSDGNDFKSFLSSLIIGGTKWGAITFLIGIIISIFAAVMVFFEKANYKQKMLNKISFIKQRKSKDLELLKYNHEMRLKMIEQNYNNRIDSAKKANEELNVERLGEENKIKEKIDAELQAHAVKLSQLV